MASALLESIGVSLRNLRANGFVTRTRTFRLLCIIAHFILVSLHIVALVIWCLHIELNAIFPVSDSGIMSDTIVVSLQAFVTVYTVMLLLITQHIAFSRLTQTSHSLTAVHDIASSWNGLGAAILGVWRQWAVPSSVAGTSCVALYLGCISVLHITTPTILSLQTGNWSTDGILPLQTCPLPIFNMTSSLAYNQSKVDAGTAFGFWDDAVELLPYFERVDYTSTIGLYGASLYGTILPNNCSGSVNTAGAAANVSCGLLPNVSIYSPASVSNHTNGYDWIQAKYYYNDSGSLLQFNISNPTAGSLSLVPYNNISEYDGQAQGQPSSTQFMGQNVIFMLATNASSGDMQAQNDFTSRNTFIVNESNSPSTYSEQNLQFVGCSLDWVLQERLVDVQTSLLSSQKPEGELLFDDPLESWQAWEPVQTYYSDWILESQVKILSPKDIDIVGVYNPSADAWYSMISATMSSPSSSSSGSLEQYLGDTLSLLKNSISASSISQFEADLANLTAIMYWSVMYLPPKSAQNASWNMTDLSFYVLPPKSFTSLAFGSSSIATRLHLNIIQISIGLGASTTLFLLAIHLTRFDGNIAPVTSLGVLQLLWLTDRQPSLSGDLGSIDNPTIENLRSAGAALQFDIMSKQSAVDGTTYETVVMDD